MHIRKTGDNLSWTSALYELAAAGTGLTTKTSIWIDGPYGSVGVNLFDGPEKHRYNIVMLLSGGIGVTPMQSICNQLMYDHNIGERPDLKKLNFVWIERDPQVLSGIDAVRRNAAQTKTITRNSTVTEGGIASTLLSLSPASVVTDYELEEMYPTDDVDADSNFDAEEVFEAFGDGDDVEKAETKRTMYGDGCTVAKSFLDIAYTRDDDNDNANNTTRPGSQTSSPLDLQVYLTGKQTPENTAPPFIYHGRPDIKQLFSQMKQEALAQGERRVAVCVCAPKRLVSICQKASVKYSDSKVCFDFHYEVFG